VDDTGLPGLGQRDAWRRLALSDDLLLDLLVAHVCFLKKKATSAVMRRAADEKYSLLHKAIIKL
jgi:hypothetical protein